MPPATERRAAVVTGGGTWLGAAMVRSLVDTGCDCLIAGRRQTKLDEVARDCADAAGQVACCQADVCREPDRRRIVEACLDTFGSIDILVNNAATTHIAPLLDHPGDAWREVMATNLEAPFLLAQHAIEHMRARRWGRIVNVASIYGSLGMNNHFYPVRLPPTSDRDRGPIRAPAYHASKGGLLSLTRDLAVAVAPYGITVNAVSPGMVPPDDAPAEENRRQEEMTPMRRTGRPEEIAHAVRFLASDEASFITGIDLVVDGGWSAW
jgi:NAD(P)-dependent dehydrogenase (short-subunit alcohol dehydrogenase family)